MKFKKHFRFNKLVNHPAYIFKEENGYYFYFFVTHQKKWKHIVNIPLTGTLDRTDTKEKNYIVPLILKAKPDRFHDRVIDDLKFHRSDGPIIRDLLKKLE